MKKTLLTIGLTGIAAFAQANTINAPAGLLGTDALNGSDAYAWGISLSLGSGESVSSAQIDFSNIKLTASGNQFGTGTIYTDLLNKNTTGITTAYDGDAAGDYWATKFSGGNIAGLGSKFFSSVGTSLTWSIVLNSTQLAALNTYLAGGGTFNIGIDPDCHFDVGNIDFTYTLSKSSTNQQGGLPDTTATAALLLVGVGALEFFRRRFVFAKSVA